MAGLFDEDLAHCPRGRAEEMAPAFPAGIPAPHQPEIRLVDQGRRLKGLAGGQPGCQSRGQAPQLRVEHRQQFRRRLLYFGWSFLIWLGHGKKIVRIFDPSVAPFSDVMLPENEARCRQGRDRVPE